MLDASNGFRSKAITGSASSITAAPTVTGRYLRTRGLPFSRESIGPLPPKRFDAIFKARSGEPVRSP